jgi:glycosyltransferase involved in cell wall biosynthesis
MHYNRPPHVVFIVENDTVPTDIRVWREAQTTRKAGYDVSVIAPMSPVFAKRHEVIDGIHIYRHPMTKDRGDKLNHLLEYANACLWEFTLCLQVFFKKRFDIIHAANPPDHLFLIANMFRPFGVRFIFDHHDLSPELYLSKYSGSRNLVYRVLKLFEMLSCKSADAVISTNESYKRLVVERHGIRPESVFIVRNNPVVDDGPKEKIEKKASANGLMRLLYVGSINIQDGVDLLVRAIQILVNELNQPKIHCTVVGDGDHLQCVRSLCDELRMRSFFTFTGFVHDRRIVKKYIEAADICVEPAPDNEANRKSTFIKVMEYMLSAKPIVAFDLEETRFSLGNGGVLIEPNNLQGFAEAIQDLIENPSKRRRLGHRARTRIVDGLNWDSASKELIRAYNYAQVNENPKPRS